MVWLHISKHQLFGSNVLNALQTLGQAPRGSGGEAGVSAAQGWRLTCSWNCLSFASDDYFHHVIGVKLNSQ